MKIILSLLLLAPVLSFSQVKTSKTEIGKLIDDWHKAAAIADFNSYFDMMSSDAIFLGTDAKERWTKDEFMNWAKPYFEKESAWTLTPIERHIYISNNSLTAWFDEKLDTGMGPARGSGVLIKNNVDWKIVHYNLSLTIPNEIIPQVRKLVEDEFDK